MTTALYMLCRVAWRLRWLVAVWPVLLGAVPVAHANEPEELRLFVIVEGGLYGYIDAAGAIVVSPCLQRAGPFSEGLAAVCVGNRYGYIDTSGEFVLKPRFRKAYAFSEGLARIEDEMASGGTGVGYVDRSGRIVVSPRYPLAEDFHEGLAVVGMPDYSAYRYIDAAGTANRRGLRNDALSCSGDYVRRDRVYRISGIGYWRSRAAVCEGGVARS